MIPEDTQLIEDLKAFSKWKQPLLWDAHLPDFQPIYGPFSVFSILYINVASLSKHADDLKILLTQLSHNFDVINET